MNKDDILRLIKNYLHSEVIDPGVQLNSNSKFRSNRQISGCKIDDGF